MRQHASGRAAEEDVGLDDDIGQRAQLGLLREACLRFVVATGAAFIDQTLGVADIDVLACHTEADHDVQAGDGRRAGARDRDLHVLDAFAHQFQPVEQGRAGDDGGAVLVVMEQRNVHALAQLLLDVEALGCLDVFEVDAAQRGFQRSDDFDQLVGVALGQFNVEDVDAGKLLEQTALAFHHRFGCQRADVAQAQHRRAIGDDAHQIAARGVLVDQRGVRLDVQTGVGDTG